MFPKVTFKRVFFIAAIAILFTVLVSHVAYADEMLPIPTFDPNPESGWDSYLELLSAIPSATPSVKPSPGIRDASPVDSSPSPEPTNPPVTSLPNAPQVSGMSISFDDSGYPLLTWAPISGYTYDVWRSRTSSGGYIYLSTVSSPSYTDHDIYDTGYYYYRVRVRQGNAVGTLNTRVSINVTFIPPSVTSDPWEVTPSPTSEPLPLPTEATYNYYVISMADGSPVYTRDGTTSNRPPDDKDATSFNSGWRLTNVNLSARYSVLKDSSDTFNLIFNSSFPTPLPPGYSLSVFSRNPWIYIYNLLPDIDYTIPDLIISAELRMTFSDSSVISVVEALTLDSFHDGFTLNYLNDRDLPITSISLIVSIVNNNPANDHGDVVGVFLRSGNNMQTSYVYITLSPPPDSSSDIEKQTSTIGGFFKSLFSGIFSIFIPNSDMIQNFINQKVSTLDNSPLAPAWTITVRLLSILSDPASDPPSLSFAGYSINILGATYSLIPSFEVNFNDIPSNLLTYSRMVGDIWLCLAFFKYLSSKLKALFNLKFADTLLELDNDDSNPSIFSD